MDEIEKVMPKFDIYIYTTEACNKCRMLKDFIDENWMVYIEKDANKFYDEIAESWLASAPIVKVIKGDEVLYFDLDDFMKFLKEDGII